MQFLTSSSRSSIFCASAALLMLTISSQAQRARNAVEIKPGIDPATIPVGSPPANASDTILPPPQIEWKEIAKLPPPSGFDQQSGVAGMYAGSQELILMIAGGANFAGGESWAEAPRSYWNQIYVLEKTRSEDGNHQFKWLPAKAELPRAMAYGASVNLPEGVLCIGGRDVNQCYADCFLMQWNASEQKVQFVDFPKLPTALAHHSAVKIDQMVYVIGGRNTAKGAATKTFYALDLTKQNDPAAFVWKSLSTWDGSGRFHALAAAGTDGESESLYLCGGRNPGKYGEDDFLTDLHRFDPRQKTWSYLGSALDPAGNIATLMAAPTFFVPPHHLVVVGGTDEKLIGLLEDNASRAATEDPTESAARKNLNQLILKNFPGYSRNVMAFDIIASEWIPIGTFPDMPPVATVVVPWDGNYVIPGGELGPGQRTPKIWQASVKKKARVVE
jgi:solute:Na+ symporter, SSS family